MQYSASKNHIAQVQREYVSLCSEF